MEEDIFDKVARKRAEMEETNREDEEVFAVVRQHNSKPNLKVISVPVEEVEPDIWNEDITDERAAPRMCFAVLVAGLTLLITGGVLILCLM